MLASAKLPSPPVLTSLRPACFSSDFTTSTNGRSAGQRPPCVGSGTHHSEDCVR